MKVLIPAVMIGLTLARSGQAQGAEKLDTPGFHHVHLNSIDPDAAIDFYVRNFPSTSRSTWGGMAALKAGNVYLLFTKVSAPPPFIPQTAIWQFGWQVIDQRASLNRYRSGGARLLPLYTGDGDNFVYFSSDTWPGASGAGGGVGRTRTQIAEAKAQGVQPTRGPGFGFIADPDGATIEYVGDSPTERFSHVHLYEEDPFCAQLWYQKHLNARAGGRGPQVQHTEADCKVARGAEPSWPSTEKQGSYRIPQAGVAFADVVLTWNMNQGEAPPAPTRGHVVDHFALSVANLDAWVAKLRGENVHFLEQTYRVGDARAVMIEGPSREAIELVEVK
jgi:catechol 2,3-dioxygenase-like lactoylglutathione lyase family enzyme